MPPHPQPPAAAAAAGMCVVENSGGSIVVCRASCSANTAELQGCCRRVEGWRGGGGGSGCLHHTGTVGGTGGVCVCCPTAPQLFRMCFSGLEKSFFLC